MSARQPQIRLGHRKRLHSCILLPGSVPNIWMSINDQRADAVKGSGHHLEDLRFAAELEAVRGLQVASKFQHHLHTQLP